MHMGYIINQADSTFATNIIEGNMKFRSVAGLVGVCALLSACGSIENETWHPALSWDSKRVFVAAGVDSAPNITWECTTNQEKAAEAAKWEDAVTVAETIKDHVYQSGLISLKVGVPHIITVTNLDDQARSFRAPGLFAKSSVLKIVHEGEDVTASCLQAVAVAPQKTSEIHLVPLEKGYFDYRDTFLSPPILTEITTLGAVGLAYVY